MLVDRKEEMSWELLFFFAYLFDFDAVNEVVINALVHNDWTMTELQISMFEDRLEILSHGGLPIGMTEAQFFKGISKPRKFNSDENPLKYWANRTYRTQNTNNY